MLRGVTEVGLLYSRLLCGDRGPKVDLGGWGGAGSCSLPGNSGRYWELRIH